MTYLDRLIEDLRSELTGFITVVALSEDMKLDRTWVSRILNLPGAPIQKMYKRETWVNEIEAREWIIVNNRNLRRKLQKI
jgi:hypothetical protein